jgi:NAD(P)-dependent dehydrogenase (short-subunit alcohol dehydrogenase family)
VTKDIILQSKSPKFIVITSSLGSVETGPNWPGPFTAYGASKAAVNWITKKIHVDYQSKGLSKLNFGLIGRDIRLMRMSTAAALIHPGLVETDMSKGVVDAETIKNNSISTEVSAKSILTIVDEATVEKDGGVFRSFDGTVIPW